MVRRMNFAAARRHWKWPLLASAGIAGAIAALDRNQPVASVIAPASAVAGVSSFDLPAALPVRATLGRLRADPFAAPAVHAPPVQAASAPPEPAAPPVPFRFAGTLQHGGILRAVLGAGERIHLVRGGEVLEDLYRVHAVSRNTVTLIYLPLGIEQQVAYAPDAPSAAPGPVAHVPVDLRP